MYIHVYILELCKFVGETIGLYTKREDLPTNYFFRYRDRLTALTSQMTLHSSGPFVMSIKKHNNLPSLIKNLKSETKFTKAFLTCLMLKVYYTLHEYLADENNVQLII